MPDALAEDPADPSPVLDLRTVAAAMSSLSARAARADGSPLDDLVAAALDLVPGTRWASVTTLRRGRFSTRAATDQVAVRADVLQYELGAGPCVDSVLDHPLYVTGDVGDDPRWLAWGRRVAAELGVSSVVAQRLHLHEESESIAALNLYSPEPDAFDDEAVGVALVLATHAAAVVSQHLVAVRARNLLKALESSREIGVAMGILMEQDQLTRDEAFAVLRVASQGTNRKLSDVAAEVADTGSLRIPHPMSGRRERPLRPPPESE